MISPQRAPAQSDWPIRWPALVLLVAAMLALRGVLKFPWAQLPAAFLSQDLEASLALMPVVPVIIALRKLRRHPAGPDLAMLAVAVLAATLPGLCLWNWLLVVLPHRTPPAGFGFTLLGRWFEYSVLGMILALIEVYHERMAAAESALHEAQLHQVRIEHQFAEARLQSLQSQIEPHLLFNTLANVRRLTQSDPAAAQAMLRQLACYLRVSLPHSRADEVTLGEELALAEAYLKIQSIRMGPRLNWRIEAAEELAGVGLPPMILSTLVENAIKHGLGPLPEGGMLSIRASAIGDRLRLEVADDGQGFEGSGGSGVGLANVRTRLQLLYGDAARLDLTDNRPRGVVATVELPRRAARAA